MCSYTAASEAVTVVHMVQLPVSRLLMKRQGCFSRGGRGVRTCISWVEVGNLGLESQSSPGVFLLMIIKQQRNRQKSLSQFRESHSTLITYNLISSVGPLPGWKPATHILASLKFLPRSWAKLCCRVQSALVTAGTPCDRPHGKTCQSPVDSGTTSRSRSGVTSTRGAASSWPRGMSWIWPAGSREKKKK